jgi:GTP:adenosylcobinamide-phosphate guanylyltransferase
VRVVEESEVSSIDPLGLSFFNINTPEDLAQAEERLRGDASRKGELGGAETPGQLAEDE